MIETQARVLSTEQSFAWVEPRSHSPWGQCDPVTGCRSLSNARTFPRGEVRFRVHNPLGALVSELTSVLAGLLGFAATLLAVRRFARRYRHSALFQPTITARYPAEPFTMEKTCRSRN